MAAVLYCARRQTRLRFGDSQARGGVSEEVTAPMVTSSKQANPAGSTDASLSLRVASVRYLGLLLLLTPLLGGVRFLLRHEALGAPPQVVTQFVQVPYPVYVPVPGPSAGERQVPGEATAGGLAATQAGGPPPGAPPPGAPAGAAAGRSGPPTRAPPPPAGRGDRRGAAY